jgi:hypothetical protein
VVVIERSKPILLQQHTASTIKNGTCFTGSFKPISFSSMEVHGAFLKVDGHIVDLATHRIYGAGMHGPQYTVFDYEEWPNSKVVLSK